MADATIRTLNDLNPQPMLAEPLASPEPEAPEASATDTLADRISRFEGLVYDRLIVAKDAMLTARQKEGVDKNYWYEEKKYKCEAKPTLNQDGSIDETAEFAHLKAGLTLGLFTDNCTVIPPILIENLLRSGEAPYVLEPVGDKQENDLKEALVDDLLSKQIDRSGWLGEMQAACREVVKHGTAIVRQSWAEINELVQTEPGVWEELCTYKGVVVKQWPLLDCYISNPERRLAKDQDAVIWVSQTTLSALAQNEMVFELGVVSETGPDGNPVPAPRVAKRGRFVNLEALRDYEAMLAHKEYEQRATQENAEGFASAETVYDLYEFQGRFPVGAMIRSGELTPDMLGHYGVKLNLGDGLPMNRETAARMADRLTWYISIVKENGHDGRGQVIEFRPCPYRLPRNEMLACRFIDSGRFYGLSTDKIAHDVGDAADAVLNNIVDIVDSKANPMKLGARGLFTNERDQEKIERGESGFVWIDRGDVDPKQAIHYLVKDYDPSMPELLRLLIDTYNARTMTTQNMKGAKAQTQSGTYAEIDSQNAEAERRLVDIIHVMAEITLVVPSVRLMIDDMTWFQTDEELNQQAVRVAGERGLEARAIFPTGEDGMSGRPVPLVDEFIVRHPGNASIRKEVASQFLLSIAAATVNMPEADRRRMYEEAITLFGLNGKDFFFSDEGPLSPRKELMLIMGGDRVKPNRMEDAIGVHLPTHMQQMTFLQNMRAGLEAAGETTEAVDGWIVVLQEHLLDTEDLAQQQMAMMMQAQAAAASQEPKPGEKRSDKGGVPDDGVDRGKGTASGSAQPGAVGAPPTGPDKIVSGMVANATGVPGMAA